MSLKIGATSITRNPMNNPNRNVQLKKATEYVKALPASVEAKKSGSLLNASLGSVCGYGGS